MGPTAVSSVKPSLSPLSNRTLRSPARSYYKQDSQGVKAQPGHTTNKRAKGLRHSQVILQTRESALSHGATATVIKSTTMGIVGCVYGVADTYH